MTSIFPHSSEDEGCYQMCLSSHHLSFSLAAWFWGDVCHGCPPWGRGLPGGQIQPLTGPLLLGLRECSVCCLSQLPPLWHSCYTDDWSGINNTCDCVTLFLLLVESENKRVKPAAVGGLCARFSADCVCRTEHIGAVHLRNGGAWMCSDTGCVVIALLCTLWARKLPPTPVRDLRLSRLYRRCPFTPPAHTLTVLQPRTVKHPRTLWVREKTVQVIRQSHFLRLICKCKDN